MDFSAAQRQVRAAYRSGSVGQAYAGLVWLASAAAWLLRSPTAGVLVLLVGGFFIYPVTTVVSRLLGGEGRIGSDNPLRELGFTAPIAGPLGIPVAGAAALHDINWFYPALMIVMGAHYLPFSTLYGMRSFLWLGAGMWAVGIVVALWLPALSVLAGISTGLALTGFAVAVGRADRRTEGGDEADSSWRGRFT